MLSTLLVTTAVDHLDELRSRILKSLAVFMLFTILLYSFSDALLFLLAKPVGSLLIIEPAEAFVSYIKVALWGGFFFASPFILYQAWAFVVSGLREHEKKYLAFFLPVSFSLFCAGGAFGLFLIIPLGIRLLLSFGSEYMQPMITVSKYISFVGTLTLVFGLVFQLPIVLLFLTKAGIVSTLALRRKRKHAIVGIFILAAIITPPDVISQLSMALPLIVLYEIGLFFATCAQKNE